MAHRARIRPSWHRWTHPRHQRRIRELWWRERRTQLKAERLKVDVAIIKEISRMAAERNIRSASPQIPLRTILLMCAAIGDGS